MNRALALSFAVMENMKLAFAEASPQAIEIAELRIDYYAYPSTIRFEQAKG